MVSQSVTMFLHNISSKISLHSSCRIGRRTGLSLPNETIFHTHARSTTKKTQPTLQERLENYIKRAILRLSRIQYGTAVEVTRYVLTIHSQNCSICTNGMETGTERSVTSSHTQHNVKENELNLQ